MNAFKIRSTQWSSRVYSLSDGASILILVSFFACVTPRCQAQQSRKRFTVSDEIELTLFGTPNGGAPEVRFSPDGNYFAVWSERGRLDLNCVEDSLRFYRTEDVEAFLKHPDTLPSVNPVWIVNRSDKEGTVINDWRWLPDSSGVAYVEGAYEFSDRRLMLAD